MKKIILLASVAFVALSVSSCKKEYTCECEVLGVKTSTTAEFKKKSEADDWKDACESVSYCKIK